MEALQRVTRRMAHKLLKEKSLPNRLQRLTSGGFKRKADFFTLNRNKRRKLAKSVEEAIRLKKGKIDLSENSVGNEEVQIFVELPADMAFSFNTLKMNADDMEVGSDRRLADDRDGCVLMDAPQPGAVSGIEEDLDCGVSGMDGCVLSESMPYAFSLVIDTDSEEQSILVLGEDLTKGGEEMQKDDATSRPMKPFEELDSTDGDVVQVEMPEKEMEVAQVLNNMDLREIGDVHMLDKIKQEEIGNSRCNEIPQGEINDPQTCNDNDSLLEHVKEESETEGSCLGLNEMPERKVNDAKACNGSGSLLDHVKEEFQTEGGCLGLNKMPEREINDAQACNGSDSLLRHAKEEPEAEGICLGLNKIKGSVDGGGNCKSEQLKWIRKSGPGSKWLYSGSRFAAFLRSAVGVIDLDADDQLLQNHGKAAAKQKSGSADDRYFPASSPPKRQSARFPGKRKVTLSPSSQLKLLEASKSSSYRRMLPFCAELAKDLATQSTLKESPRADCTFSKQCDIDSDKGLAEEPFVPEQIKSEKNESGLATIVCDQELRSTIISEANVELEDNNGQRELPTGNKEMSREPQRIGRVQVEQDENQMELIPSDGQISMESSHIARLKLQRNECQSESAFNDEKMIMGPPSTGQVKLEQNGVEMKLPFNTEGTSRNTLCAERVSFHQNGCQTEFAPGNEEFCRVTKPAMLKDIASQLMPAIDNGLCNTGLSVGNSNLEQSGNQSESGPCDQFLRRKSLFVENVRHGQSGNESESAIGDQIFSRGSFYAGCVKPGQTECQSKSASTQLESSPACHSPSDDLGMCFANGSSGKTISLVFSNGQLISALPTQKFPTLDAESISQVDQKSLSPSPCGSSDITLFPSCSEVPSPLHTPASVPSKGILKCSHRSCKGMCLCSDCASFRLQAERASEFSERQLRETETLAVALMTELNNVRNLLDKCLIAKGKGTRILCSIPHSQVKDASRSALRAEETARDHLVQMTRDCHLHCKILRMQQRKVKFADKVEVKMFKSE